MHFFFYIREFGLQSFSSRAFVTTNNWPKFLFCFVLCVYSYQFSKQKVQDENVIFCLAFHDCFVWKCVCKIK